MINASEDVAVVDASVAYVVDAVLKRWLAGPSGQPLTVDKDSNGGVVIAAGYPETEITQVKAREMLGSGGRPITHGTFYRNYVLTGKITILPNRKVRLVDVLRAQGRLSEVEW